MAKVLYTGIDLSKWNGKIDWDKLVNKKLNETTPDFAILKACSTKTKLDPRFEENYAEAKRVGIHIGAYYYSEALTEEAMLNDAERFYAVIKDKDFDFPIYLDFEEQKQLSLGQKKLESIIKVFTDFFEQKGYYIGLYSSQNGLQVLSESFRNRYSIWCARIGAIPAIKTYDMWQYTWKARFVGIGGDTDCNYCYKDFPSIIKKAGLNNMKCAEVPAQASSPEPQPTAPTISANYTKYIPDTVAFYTPMEKNVISTFKKVGIFNATGNIRLSNHFQVKEFMSKSGVKVYTDEVKIHNKLIEILEALYAKLDCSKIIVNSGYRTKEHDLAVGGDGVGQHTLGRAADITCYDKKGKVIPAQYVCCALEDMGGIYGIGYISPTSTHVDTRFISKKWWGDETKAGAPNISRLGYNSFYDYFGIKR